MSRKKQISKNKAKFYTIFSYCVVTLISACKIAYSVPQSSPYFPSLVPLSGLFGTSLLFLSLLFLFMFEEKKAFRSIVLPIIAAILSGIYFENILDGTLVAISFLCVGFCSYLIYSGYKNGEQKSTLCSYSSFVFTIFELLKVVILISVTAISKNVKFTSLLFSTLEEIINSYTGYYVALLENATKLSPELYTQIPSVDQSSLYSSMATVLSLIPAILYVAYFVVNFITVTIFDRMNCRYNVIKGKKFSKYDIAFTVYLFFMIFGTVYVFSMFFEYSLSPATAGILSVVLALLPHFVILAYRRLYAFFLKFSGKTGTVVLLFILSGTGFVFLMQLYLYILAFIGTAEYRRIRMNENKNKFIS